MDPTSIRRSRRRRRQRRKDRRRHGRTRAFKVGFAALVLLSLPFVALAFAGGVVVHHYYGYYASCDLDSLQPIELGQNSTVYAAGGEFLGVIPSTRNRQPVPLAAMSPWLTQATVAAEDRRFYQHAGVDWTGIARAAYTNVKAGEVVQGGSSISQQLVRNLYTGEYEQTIERKLKEACLAEKLSARWSHERVLAAYLNYVYYGAHAYGVEAAAKTYFDKPARRLNLQEAALIAGLPQAPSRYDPFVDPRAARERRNEVLKAMQEAGMIGPRASRQAARSPLKLHPGQLYQRIKEPLFFNYVHDQLVAQYGAAVVREGGLSVRTTLDLKLQRRAYAAIKDTLNLSGDPAAALVSIDPRSGQIRAMAARAPGERLQFNLAAQGHRPAGSAFKPFTLAAGMEAGLDPYSTYYLSAPFYYDGPLVGKPWRVATAEHSYSGSISVAEATVHSDNTVYARLVLDVGPKNVAKLANRVGIQSRLRPVPSITLGTNSVSPLEMASAYATLSAQGVYRRPSALASVRFPGGRVERFRAPAKRVLEDGIAYEVTKILEQNVQRGTGTRARLARPVAGKTGTTENYGDAWFCGYVPQLTTAVWVGYPHRERSMTSVHGITVFGGTFPAEIWHSFMESALRGVPTASWPQPKRAPTYAYWRGEHQYADQAG